MCGAGRWEYVIPMCVLFGSNTSGIAFNPGVDAITGHSQKAMNIDPYFKSQLYVVDPGHQKPVFILMNELSTLATFLSDAFPQHGILRTEYFLNRYFHTIRLHAS